LGPTTLTFVSVTGSLLTSANVGEQTREHRLVNAIGMSSLSAGTDANLASNLAQLAIQVTPLANTQPVQVFITA
jgi:hypothetical protein